jgi:hypothetical protein
MTNILTAAEAANFVRTDAGDAVMLQLLPLVDQYLLNATGHDWKADSSIHKTAVTAAGMLLVYWYDNPMLIGQAPAALSAALVQLEAEALKYHKYCFYGNNGIGGIALPGALVGQVVIRLEGVYVVTGNQATKFESVITIQNQIQQIHSGNLAGNQYVVVLKHPAEDVSA